MCIRDRVTPVSLADDRDRKHCINAPYDPRRWLTAPPWLGYGYVGRKYSLLDRPLDVVPDCHPDFGFASWKACSLHVPAPAPRRRMVAATLTVCERGETVQSGGTHVHNEYRDCSYTRDFKRSDRGTRI